MTKFCIIKNLKRLTTCAVCFALIMSLIGCSMVPLSTVGTKSIATSNISMADSKDINKASITVFSNVQHESTAVGKKTAKALESERVAELAKKAQLAKKVQLTNVIKLNNKAKAIVAATSERKLQEITEKIKAYMGNEYSHISVDYLDLTSGETIQINNAVIMHTASTIKVPVVMLIMDMLNEGSLKQTDTLTYIASDYEGGTGKLQNMDKSHPFNVMMLCEYAIRYSDNIALNMLLREVGYNSVVPELNSKLGIQWSSEPNHASAAMMTKVLSHLYNASNPYYAKEISWLKQTIFHDRIDKYIPENIVAHKIGDYGSFTHDVGIVYAQKPYILSVYTNGLSNAAERIAQISKIVYENR